MNPHRYQVSVQEVAAPGQAPLADEAPIDFEFSSHDELHDIVGRARRLGAFDDETATAFAIGLKMLGGVILDNRDAPLFAEFGPQFGQFMRSLKGGEGRGGAGHGRGRSGGGSRVGGAGSPGSNGG